MILQVKDYEQSYTKLGKTVFGLENISFDIEPGFIYGLVGRNGAGKTTLIQSIATGNCKGGEILYDGNSMAQNPVICKNMLGLISDPPMLLANKTALENGEIFGQFYDNWNSKAYEEKLREFRVDYNVLLSRMSRGEVMKVATAFAWGHRAKLLLADEPSAGFDPLFRKEFLHFLQEYVEDGEHSVIMSTHILEDLDQVADYIMILQNGALVVNQSMEEMRDQYTFIKEQQPSILDVMLYLEKRG